MTRVLLFAGVLVSGVAVAATVALAAGSAGGHGGGAVAGIIMGKPFIKAPGVIDGPSSIPVTGVGSTNFLRRVPLVRTAAATAAPNARMNAARPLCRETVKGVLILRGRACEGGFH